MSCTLNTLRRSASIFGAALILLLGSGSLSPSSAQIVYSVGTQQVYDSNIYLEDKGNGGGPADPDGNQFEEFDGELNEDFISNPYVAMAGRIPTGSKMVTNFSTRLGAVLYTDNDQENRFTVDGMLSFKPEDGVMPEYWTIGLTEGISSQANAIGIAQGGATRQGQLNTITLMGGLNQWFFTGKDSLSAPLSVSRQDFLGQFLFNEEEEDRRQTIEGVDSMTYAFSPKVDHRFNDRWSANLTNTVQYYDVTGGDSNDLASGGASNDADRINYSPSLGVNYTASDRLRIGGQTGVDFSRFVNDRQVTVLDENGNPVTTAVERDDSFSNLFYGGNLSYALAQTTSLGLNVLQTAGTDIGGNRLLVRTVGANGSHLFTDRISANLGFNFTQFTQGDSLDKPSERYEALANVRYSITDAISISAGYSYAKQNRPSGGDVTLFNNGDYEGHRAFVSLDTGFVAFTR